jgi:HAD superfamily hydrolase (TIGR01549 family)
MSWKDPYDQFHALSVSTGAQVVSVDIFDTLLFRTTLPESVKFKRFGKAMYDALPVKPADIKDGSSYLQQLRLLAAKTIYHQKPMVKGAREATLEELYDYMVFALSKHLPLTDAQCQQLMAEFRGIERELEIKDLSVNHYLITTLKQARAAGKKVIAISDMYLRADDLDYLLEAFDLRSLFDDVYVSSEFGYGKASGVLFETALSDMCVQAEQLCHIGDNYHSDFAMPSSKNIHAVFAPRPKWWRFSTRVRGRLKV